jgi:hypothetical protein
VKCLRFEVRDVAPARHHASDALGAFLATARAHLDVSASHGTIQITCLGKRDLIVALAHHLPSAERGFRLGDTELCAGEVVRQAAATVAVGSPPLELARVADLSLPASALLSWLAPLRGRGASVYQKLIFACSVHDAVIPRFPGIGVSLWLSNGAAKRDWILTMAVDLEGKTARDSAVRTMLDEISSTTGFPFARARGRVLERLPSPSVERSSRSPTHRPPPASAHRCASARSSGNASSRASRAIAPT